MFIYASRRLLAGARGSNYLVLWSRAEVGPHQGTFGLGSRCTYLPRYVRKDVGGL
jgi:hypothetical protein